MRSHIGGVMKKESWRMNHWGIVEEESWRGNHGRCIMEEASLRRHPAGGSQEEAGRRHPEGIQEAPRRHREAPRGSQNIFLNFCSCHFYEGLLRVGVIKYTFLLG